MPKLTLAAARKIQEKFKGRITSLHEAQVEFQGNSTVLIPESVKDVERALHLAQAANRSLFVRSGQSISATDVTDPASAVLSLETFRRLTVRKKRITVGAATTTGDVAQRLEKKGLFLPLDDNKSQSIVSSVLGMSVSPFLRSDSGVGALRNTVMEAEIVPIEGAGAGKAKVVRNKALQDVLNGRRRGVITKLVLDADAAKAGETDRWTLVWTAAYKPKTFAALCDGLLGADASKFPKNCDLSIRVTSAAYAMKLIIVRATGHGDSDPTEALIQASMKKVKLDMLESSQVRGPGSSVATWVETGPGEAASDEVVWRFGSNNAPRKYSSIRKKFLAAVDLAIGMNPRTGRDRAPGVQGWAELQLAPGTKVITRAAIGHDGADAKVAKKVLDLVAAAIPADQPSPTASRGAVLRRSSGRDVLRGVSALPRTEPTLGFDLTRSNRTSDDRIPGFKGDVIDESNGDSYRRAIGQYAVSSYSRDVVKARMTPAFVVVPTDAEDVVLAVTFAANENLKVVARSGGHQYCGLSSGGADTLLIDMRLLNDIKFSGIQTRDGAPARLVAGPGATLQRVSRELRGERVVIPHGECPRVNLGGHVQTGGIGHTLRSLGATVDMVRSFKMVTRDPQSPPGADVYVEREFMRPNTVATTGAPTDDDVFRAVLGGGPSSWGVLTEITFDLVSDEKYKDSAGYSYSYPYLFGQTKPGFRAAMEQFRSWADREHNGTLPEGVDLFLSVISGMGPRPAVLLVETMCRDRSQLGELKNVIDAVNAAVPLSTRILARLSSSVSGKEPLSYIAAEGVRKIGTFGLPRSGREFDLPYKKSLYISKVPPSTIFMDRFVDLVDEVYDSSGLKVVFQGVIGGGEFIANRQKETTHMQRRDALVQLVFDVFYEPRSESKAEDFQDKMKALLGEYSNGDDLRMLWGSFEDKDSDGKQIDMSLSATRKLYYDSIPDYERLQKIKKYTDPTDLFHTSFTVGLP